MRLIDANEANKAIETVCNEYGIAYGNNYGGFADKIASVIDNIPTIDAEPVVHGHWILDKTIFHCNVVHKCSNCKSISKTKTPYCWKCGCKMDEVSK